MLKRTKTPSTQAPAKIGRPTKYSLEWAERFCERLAQGQSVRQICSQPGQPDKSQVYRWLDENDDFRDRYARAREEQADKLFREIIEIADDASGDYVTTSDGKTIVDHENIQRSRLRVEARKWAAARLAPKRGHLLAGSVQHPLGSSRGGPTASMGSGRTEGAHVGRNQRPASAADIQSAPTVGDVA